MRHGRRRPVHSTLPPHRTLLSTRLRTTAIGGSYMGRGRSPCCQRSCICHSSGVGEVQAHPAQWRPVPSLLQRKHHRSALGVSSPGSPSPLGGQAHSHPDVGPPKGGGKRARGGCRRSHLELRRAGVVRLAAAHARAPALAREGGRARARALREAASPEVVAPGGRGSTRTGVRHLPPKAGLPGLREAHRLLGCHTWHLLLSFRGAVMV